MLTWRVSTGSAPRARPAVAAAAADIPPTLISRYLVARPCHLDDSDHRRGTAAHTRHVAAMRASPILHARRFAHAVRQTGTLSRSRHHVPHLTVHGSARTIATSAARSSGAVASTRLPAAAVAAAARRAFA